MTATSSARPRISIVIPAYNVEAYVGETLASTLAQTVPAYEIIVIDDGSTDATYEVLKGFESEPLVRLYRQSNRGLGPTRNRGASLARGDYLYFFDADDLLDPRFVERIQQAIADGAQPDVVLFSGSPFAQTPELESHVGNYARYTNGTRLDSVEAINRLLEAKGKIDVSASLYVVSRSFWLESDLRYPDILHEDAYLIMPLLLAASSITIIDEDLFHQRVRPDSITTGAWSLAHFRGYAENLRLAIELIERRPTSDPAVQKYLRRRCRRFAKYYIRQANTLGQPVQASLLVRAAVKSRSRKILKKWIKHLLARWARRSSVSPDGEMRQ